MRLAYLMHVDWNWIKQRPHFLCEALSQVYSIDLYYVNRLSTKMRTVSVSSVHSIRPIYKVPLSAKHTTLQRLEAVINYRVIQQLYRERYDYVWITSPVMLSFLDLERLHYNTLIYDCMDDTLAFPVPEYAKKQLEIAERNLLTRADIVFTSSNRLKQKVIERGATCEIVTVNNAVDLGFAQRVRGQTYSGKRIEGIYNIMYFGTISKWLDIELLQDQLNLNESVKFTLVGPSDIEIPTHPRLEHIGPIEHTDLPKVMQHADAFIMPFIRNELVEAVDPVKAYEYVATGKPTFLIQYAETEKFRGFAFLYRTSKELSEQIGSAMARAGQSQNMDVGEFLERNSWDARVDTITHVMDREVAD